MRAAEADEKIRSMIVFSTSSRPKKTCGRVGRGKGLRNVRVKAEKEERRRKDGQDWAGAG